MLLAVHQAKPGVKLALSVTALALVGVAGIARVDVGAHWPTEVIGGDLGWRELGSDVMALGPPSFIR